MTIDMNSEKALLEELNADLPAGIDWKQGAIEYLRDLIRNKGSQNELFHLIKPFQGGPDFQPFFSEMYGFLNMVQVANLPMKSHVLDVACGPGWTSQFLAKLGHSVMGVDISEDLLEIAERRIAAERHGPFEGVPLRATFACHDIEAAPLPADDPNGPYDAAFFESALHHFLNPVQVLRNVASSLKDGGILCIWEGAAPKRGTEPYRQNLELMTTYRTLERPYTRGQIERVLRLSGFVHFEFFAQVNGFFNIADHADRRRLQDQVGSAENWNICIASRTDEFFVANGRKAALADSLHEHARESGFGVALGSVDWGGRDLLKENLRYVKRRLLRLFYARHLSRQDQIAKITDAYREVLGREPDEAGLAHYMEEFRRSGSFEHVRRSMRASDEYRDRARSGESS